MIIYIKWIYFCNRTYKHECLALFFNILNDMCNNCVPFSELGIPFGLCLYKQNKNIGSLPHTLQLQIKSTARIFGFSLRFPQSIFQNFLVTVIIFYSIYIYISWANHLLPCLICKFCRKINNNNNNNIIIERKTIANGRSHCYFKYIVYMYTI